MSAIPSIIVVTGPTASGKSSCALNISEAVGGEVISADSIQVYRYFDIGSAKPAPSDLAKAKHHLISILDPTEDFNAGKFCLLANQAIHEIVSRGHVPIIVGGTGLYIQTLLNGLIELDEISTETKVQLHEFESSLSPDAKAERLYSWLQELDPRAAATIEPADIARTKRAIMVMLDSGHSIVDFQAEHCFQDRKYNALVIALCPEKSELYPRINSRTEEMLKNNLVAETRDIMNKFGPTIKPLSSIGYKSAVRYLQGTITETELAEEIKRDTRRYAKRQLTWWRNQPSKLGWINFQMSCQEGISATSEAQLATLVQNFLQYKQEVLHPTVSFVLINSFG